jgi:hypothetical protein
VFEGDIIRENVEYDRELETGDVLECYYVIKWVEKYNSYLAIPFEDGKLFKNLHLFLDSLYAIRQNSFYVVGNVHDNDLNEYKCICKEIPKKTDEFIINTTYLIAKPIFNQYKYYQYNKYLKELKIIKYYKDNINKSGINCFSTLDSYCNAMNFLYIYQNNIKNKDYDNFFKIDLVNNNIKLISSKFPKRILYSMIYIPKYYIFIIVGKNSKEVLIYNIKKEKKNYKKYPYLLPYELIEPSLIFINNKYLYIFENSTLEFHILHSDLINMSPFEDIKLSNSTYIHMNQKFFGVVQNYNTILFLGGQMINLNKENINSCYEFDYNSNKLFLSI